MLGDFIIRLLVLILGYTYPAFECYKTVEKNKVDIEELRFWCQYWILLALISSFERVGDIFISWLPLYGEMKVVFFVYLWWPKTKGTRLVYETLLKPVIAQHETEIDRKIMELRARAWDFFIFYFHNFAQAGQSTFIQAFQYVLAQSVRFSAAAAANQPPMEPSVKTRSPVETESDTNTPPGPRPLNKSLSALRSLEKQTSRGRKWPPPTPPPTPGRDSAGTFNGEDGVNIPDTLPGSPITDARAKLRRSNSRSQAAA
ncbi:HVA22-like protein j [Brassica rapa]|uniref:HVA22-like protein n=1 Tax=Brassica campestris TaxID=3711 RepID=M4DL86_BRACM|nr:HVA22-like protein j [Brassica rapa]